MCQFAARSVKVLAAWPLLARLIAGFSRWRARSLVVTLAAATAILAVGLSASPAAAVTTSITLKPSAGPPTSKVTVTGTGFGASETVAVDFSSTQVATATTSSTGAFSTPFTVPKSALPGNHPVTATGQASGRSATHNFLVRTNWAKFHFDAANSGLNPYENVIGPASVSGLKLAWTTNSGSSIGSPPAVANGVVYVGTKFSGLLAFSAAGNTGCSGSPVVCAPLWTGDTSGGQINSYSAAVSHGVVYITASDGKLYAFSAAGTTGCSGNPKVCSPLWTGTISGDGTTAQSSPAVVNGVVYVGLGNDLAAFSAAGTTGCSGTPKTCAPLWTAGNVAGNSSPAVANGVVYIGSYYGVSAFSAAGTTGCSGSPKTCNPLWTGPNIGGTGSSSPAVANGVVYAGTVGGLAAFDAAGITGCSGTPKVCSPLWTGPTGNEILATPAVAHGVIYVPAMDSKLYAFSAAGCSGGVCAPLWTAAGVNGNVSPAVANGVIYVGASSRVLAAFSAAGTTGCSGSPVTCSPLWTSPAVFGSGSGILSSPAVANGMVYIGRWTAFSQYFLAFK